MKNYLFLAAFIRCIPDVVERMQAILWGEIVEIRRRRKSRRRAVEILVEGRCEKKRKTESKLSKTSTTVTDLPLTCLETKLPRSREKVSSFGSARGADFRAFAKKGGNGLLSE